MTSLQVYRAQHLRLCTYHQRKNDERREIREDMRIMSADYRTIVRLRTSDTSDVPDSQQPLRERYGVSSGGVRADAGAGEAFF